MFGSAAFAQVPFAALAGNASIVFISEGIQFGDASIQLTTYLISQTEPFTVDDIDATAGDFFGSVVENLNAADANTVLAAFQAAVAENITLAEAFAVSGWIKIIDAQNADWAIINDNQNSGWQNIPTVQANNWQDVNNMQ